MKSVDSHKIRRFYLLIRRSGGVVQNQESPDEIRRLGTSASTNFCVFILPTYLLLVLTVLCSVVGSTLSVFPRFFSIVLAVKNQISHFSHFFHF